MEPPKKPATKPKKTDTTLEIDWDKVVEKAKEKSLGLSSLLTPAPRFTKRNWTTPKIDH